MGGACGPPVGHYKSHWTLPVPPCVWCVCVPARFALRTLHVPSVFPWTRFCQKSTLAGDSEATFYTALARSQCLSAHRVLWARVHGKKAVHPGVQLCYKSEPLWVKPAKVPPGADGHQTCAKVSHLASGVC